jgi:plastocyanin
MRWCLALLAFCLAVATAGSSAWATEATVKIANYAFSPTELTVPVGTSVTWVNRDQSVHTVTALSGAFQSGALDTDDSYSIEFASAGDFAYVCKLHPQMSGLIHVR